MSYKNTETIEMTEIFHYPVLYREAIELLDIKNKKIIVDCTLGVASHALRFFEVMPQNSFFIGIDKDSETLRYANEKLKIFEGRYTLVKGDFLNIDTILKNLQITGADAILFDLGISMYQLKSSERGFSFVKEGPLDMRMDKDSLLCAHDLVNNLSEGELENIFKQFGEERYSRRIAHRIVEKRKQSPIATTTELAEIVTKAVPGSSLKYRIHPATRVFQALRIAVNRELEVLSLSLKKAIPLLNKNGRIGVISFHSLEDRIVKNEFKECGLRHVLNIVTKKPVIAGDTELRENMASRSAKLRVAEKI
jgi:16S rRNA (cytosine1402-N4)-methyltransferase